MFVRTLQVCCLSLVVAFFLAVASQPSPSLLQSQWTYRGGGPSFQTYVVRNGDTLVGIAARFGTDVNSLMSANGLRTDHLSIGQVLRIPGAAAPAAQPVLPAPVKAVLAGPTYVVQNGDTLLAIAYRYGVDVNTLLSANGLPSADQLSIGQVLRIPGGVAPVVAVQPQPVQPAPPVQPPVVSQPPDAVQPVHDGPADRLVPDSEAVYGPSYADFDIAAFVNRYNGLLANYHESVDGDMLSGPQVVQLVAERLSVGPRVLLTMLEMEGGWVTVTVISSEAAAGMVSAGMVPSACGATVTLAL